MRAVAPECLYRLATRARVAELVDAADLKSVAPRGPVGSNPTPGMSFAPATDRVADDARGRWRDRGGRGVLPRRAAAGAPVARAWREPAVHALGRASVLG